MAKRGRPKSPYNEEALQLLANAVYLARLETDRDRETLRNQPEKLSKLARFYLPVIRATLDGMREHGISVEAAFERQS